MIKIIVIAKTMSVDKALILGLIRLTLEYTYVEILLMPGPVTKYEMIKSSNDIVKAIKAPETITGKIC